MVCEDYADEERLILCESDCSEIFLGIGNELRHIQYPKWENFPFPSRIFYSLKEIRIITKKYNWKLYVDLL